MAFYQLFIDTSGSTSWEKEYYETVQQEYDKIPSDAKVEIYEWAANCGPLDKQEFKQVVCNRESYRVNNNDTCLSTICPYINMDATNIVIITDGRIDSKEYDEAAKGLAELVDSKSVQKLPIVRFCVRSTSDVGDSILLALASSGLEVDYVRNKNEPLRIPTAVAPDQLFLFVDSIDILEYISSKDYKKEIDAKLRLSTVNKDEEFILAVKERIDKLAKPHLDTNVDLDLEQIVRGCSALAEESPITTPPTDLMNKNLPPNKKMLRTDLCAKLKHELTRNSPDSIKQVDRGIKQLQTILDAFKDKTTLYVNKIDTNVCLPKPKILDAAVKDQTNLIDTVFVECPHTFQQGVPYLTFNPQPVEVSKKYLKQVVNNPLLVTSLFDMKRSIGSFFVHEPDKLEGRDPRTREYIGTPTTPLVLALGVDAESIQYTNQIMNKTLFNSYSVADPDLMFMSIWYYLKYISKMDYVKEVVPCFEAQLKARFEKKCPLSLSSSVYEKSNFFDKKWICIWYLIHEIPFVYGDCNAKHASSHRYLSKIDIMVSFLKDVYSISCEKIVLEYLDTYHAINQLTRAYNTADKEEFMRCVRALKTEAMYIERTDLDATKNFDKVLNVKVSNDTVKFTTGSVVVKETVEDRLSPYITIPLDERRKTGFPKWFVSMFPHPIAPLPAIDINHLMPPEKIKYLGKIDRLAELCLHLPLDKNMGDSPVLYFDRPEKNEEIRAEKVAELGFDPRTFKQFWPQSMNSKKDVPGYETIINTGTLRPQLIYKGKPWIKCAEQNFGSGRRFISLYRLWVDFVADFKQFPKLADFVYFVYCKERRRSKRVSLENGCLKCVKVDEPIFTLYANFIDSAKEVLDQFDEIIKTHNLSVKLCIQIQESSRNIEERAKMEKMTLDKLTTPV